MERKLLTDVECMSGTGWYNEDIEAECPECGCDIELINYKDTIFCPGCKKNFIIIYGKQHYWKIEFKEK